MRVAPAVLLLVAAALAGFATGIELSADRLSSVPVRLLGSEQADAAANADLIDDKRHAGYFKLDRTKDAHMFYMFFEKRNANTRADAPVVLWMNGGPGCSSELGVFTENGPYEINKDSLELMETEFGWDVFHNMIFVDQPINTGFSYSDDPSDRVMSEKRVAQDMLEFLVHFFAAHPELASNDFYITGESYGGHYVPVVAHHVWASNPGLPEDQKVNLAGLAIGNGLTVPHIQYGAYADYALDNGLISQGMRDGIAWMYPVCRIGLQLCDSWNWSFECLLALSYCQSSTFAPIMAANAGMNVYDIRKGCDAPLCYDFSHLDKFLNLPETRAALGVGDRKWQECSNGVHADFMSDIPHSYGDLLPELLADGVRVMIYAGDQDFICNWLGNRRWVDALQWEGAAEWGAADDFEWTVLDNPAGTVKSAAGLTFVKVADAGHMVPMDQGLNALDMITKFTKNEEFETSGKTVDVFKNIQEAEHVSMDDITPAKALEIMEAATAGRKQMGGRPSQ